MLIREVTTIVIVLESVGCYLNRLGLWSHSGHHELVVGNDGGGEG